jgi:hypothetical protein
MRRLTLNAVIVFVVADEDVAAVNVDGEVAVFAARLPQPIFLTDVGVEAAARALVVLAAVVRVLVKTVVHFVAVGWDGQGKGAECGAR